MSHAYLDPGDHWSGKARTWASRFVSNPTTGRPETLFGIVRHMLDTARIRRVAGRFGRVPRQLHHMVGDMVMLRREIAALRAEIATVNSTIDFATTSILDTLALTSRSIDGLSARLDKLEKRSGQGVS